VAEVTRYSVPLQVFAIGRFLPPPAIPFQRGTVVDQSPLAALEGVSGRLEFVVQGVTYTADITTDTGSRQVHFVWTR